MSEVDKHKGEKINGRGIQSVGKGGYTLNTEVREAFKAMRNAMVNLLFIGVGFVVGLADTLGNNL